MQTLAFLWFELDVTQKHLRETFAELQLAVKARNLSSSRRWCFSYRIFLRKEEPVRISNSSFWEYR
jgi:hypothetical protein